MEAQLAQQQKSLESQLDIFQGLLKEDLANPTTVYFGDGYFVSLPVTEAKDFINRKIEKLQQELSTLNHLSGVNDEGLPILDIVEELDDEDQIVTSTLNRTGLGAQLAQTQSDNQTLFTNLENEDSEVISNLTPAEPCRDQPEVSSETLDPPTSVGKDSLELLKEATTERSANDSDPNVNEYEFVEDVSLNPSRSNSEDNSQGEYRDINPAEILELEPTNDGESDEEPIDFDFDNLEEEEDNELFLEAEDDDDDDDYFDDEDFDDEDDEDTNENHASHNSWMSKAGSLFPQNESTRKLIETHLRKQEKSEASEKAKSVSQSSSRNKPNATGSENKAAKTSHVHFADSVDVRLFETSSKERKFTAADLAVKKPSRFRTLRQPVSVNSNNTPVSKSSNKAGLSAAAAAAAAVARNPTKPAVSNQIKERETPKSPSKSILPDRTNGPLARKQVIASPNMPTSGNIDSQDCSKHAKLETEPINEMVAERKEPTIGNDTKGLINDSEKKQVSAILTPAQIKAKIANDAQNYYEQSFVPDEDFLALHDTTSDDQTGDQPKDTKEPSAKSETALKANNPKPVLSSSVIERIDESNEEDSDENDEPLVDMKEIKREYQRLRQKLIYESGGYIKKPIEKEFEPIDPDGEPKKVSRFKAARIG